LKATVRDHYWHKEGLRRERERGETFKKRKRDVLERIREAKRSVRDDSYFRFGDDGYIKIVVARKDYRCCGYDCQKIIGEGTKHFTTLPEHRMDSWWKACSLKCAINAESIQSSNEYVVTVRPYHKLSKNVVDPTIRR